MFSLPEPDPGPGPEIEPVEPQSPWSAADIIAFVVFFIGVWLILPYSFIHLWQVFKPTMKVTDLTAVDQVLLQGVMNVVLVGFIALLIKRVHGKSFFADFCSRYSRTWADLWWPWPQQLRSLLSFMFFNCGVAGPESL